MIELPGGIVDVYICQCKKSRIVIVGWISKKRYTLSDSLITKLCNLAQHINILLTFLQLTCYCVLLKVSHLPHKRQTKCHLNAYRQQLKSRNVGIIHRTPTNDWKLPSSPPGRRRGELKVLVSIINEEVPKQKWSVAAQVHISYSEKWYE